jgi:hypothetical protein
MHIQDIRSSEYGLELFKGDKYDWTFKEDTYTLFIKERFDSLKKFKLYYCKIVSFQYLKNPERG